MATFPIYQIYVELEEYCPKMWRRFQVMGDTTIARLGYIIMGLYEIKNNYSYEFRIDELSNYKKKHPEYVTNSELLKGLNRTFRKIRYGITSKRNMYTYNQTGDYEELSDATTVRMIDVFKVPDDEIIFRYDPEINWTFKLMIEKIFTDKNLYSKELPNVLEGEGFGILEQLNRNKGFTRGKR